MGGAKVHATGSNYMPKAIIDRRPMSAAYFDERLLADPGLWGIPIGNRRLATQRHKIFL